MTQCADFLICVLQFDHNRILVRVKNLVVQLDPNRDVLLRQVGCSPDVLLDLDEVDGTFLEEFFNDVNAFIVCVDAILDDVDHVDSFFSR